MAPSPDWKATNCTIQILKAAADGNYGVLATVAYNIEHILGMIHAAELAHSPLIVQFFPWAITFSSVLLIRTAANAASRAKVPVAVHLDHAQDEEQGVEMVVRQTMEWMEICGSSGRAKGNFGVIKDGSI